MKQVLVLGSGASGLMASWAAINAGYAVTVWTAQAGPPSAPPGIFVLHNPCRLPLRSAEMQVLVTGAKSTFNQSELYRQKLYGETKVEVSLPDDNEVQRVWDGQQALSMLWDITKPFVQERRVKDWKDFLWVTERDGFVVSTIPLPALLGPEGFPKQEVRVWAGVASEHEAYMMYSVNLSVPWYRASAVFGRFTLEYVPGFELPEEIAESKRLGSWMVAQKVLPPEPGAIPLVPSNALLAGRYGAWDKSKLVHNVFEDVMNWLP